MTRTLPAILASDGWIEWSGGSQCPVAPGTETSVRLRNGKEVSTCRPAHLMWQHVPCGADIIAYRVVPSC